MEILGILSNQHNNSKLFLVNSNTMAMIAQLCSSMQMNEKWSRNTKQQAAACIEIQKLWVALMKGQCDLSVALKKLEGMVCQPVPDVVEYTFGNTLVLVADLLKADEADGGCAERILALLPYLSGEPSKALSLVGYVLDKRPLLSQAAAAALLAHPEAGVRAAGAQFKTMLEKHEIYMRYKDEQHAEWSCMQQRERAAETAARQARAKQAL